MKRLIVAFGMSLAAACGAPSEAPSTPAAPPPSGDPAVPVAAEVSASPAPQQTATPASSSAAPETPASPSKDGFVEAHKIVADAYPAPFEKTYAAVLEKLGEPKRKSENMNEWYARDGGKCVMFFMTKDNKKGHAASGIAETNATDCNK